MEPGLRLPWLLRCQVLGDFRISPPPGSHPNFFSSSLSFLRWGDQGHIHLCDLRIVPVIAQDTDFGVQKAGGKKRQDFPTCHSFPTRLHPEVKLLQKVPEGIRPEASGTPGWVPRSQSHSGRGRPGLKGFIPQKLLMPPGVCVWAGRGRGGSWAQASPTLWLVMAAGPLGCPQGLSTLLCGEHPPMRHRLRRLESGADAVPTAASGLRGVSGTPPTSPHGSHRVAVKSTPQSQQWGSRAWRCRLKASPPPCALMGSRGAGPPPPASTGSWHPNPKRCSCESRRWSAGPGSRSSGQHLLDPANDPSDASVDAKVVGPATAQAPADQPCQEPAATWLLAHQWAPRVSLK